MVSLKNQPTVVDEDFSLGVRERVKSQANSQGEEDLLLAEVG
jgi:hypothetical protein